MLEFFLVTFIDFDKKNLNAWRISKSQSTENFVLGKKDLK